MISFRVIFIYSEKCTEWLQNDHDMFKVKNINMHATCTPDEQIFIRFIQRWAIFDLRPNFGKSAPNDPNDLDMLKVKNTNIHSTYTL